MNATLVSNPQNHNRKKKKCQLYNIDSWNSYEWLCWRSLWKWYFTLHSMNYSGPSWAFLQESKVSCSRAKPTRSNFSFLWIRWRQQICRARHDGQRARSDCGCRWQRKRVSTDHVYRSNLISSSHGSKMFGIARKMVPEWNRRGTMVDGLIKRVASIKRVVAPTWLLFVYLILSRKFCQCFWTTPPRPAKYDQETQHHRPSVCRDQFVRAPLFATETSSILLPPNPGGFRLLYLIFETCCEQQQQPREVLGNASDTIHALPTAGFRFAL